MAELRELRKPAKPQGATRVWINEYKRNIYHIDLIDFSSKQDRWVQSILQKRTSGFYKNRGYKFVLVCIDGYTRYLMIRKLKTKTATEVAHAMNDIIKTYGAPRRICTDRGSEFVNATFRTNVLKPTNIEFTPVPKAVFAERAIRDIKERIMVPFNQSKGVWVDAIDGAVREHNAARNRSTGYSPNEMWQKHIVYTEPTEPPDMDVKDRTPQFAVGDYVRVAVTPDPLRKRSLTYKWSEELYRVTEIDDQRMPLMYKLSPGGTQGSRTNRKCYHWELLASRCKPSARDSPPVTRSRSRTTPDALRQAARTHRPVTRGSHEVRRSRSRTLPVARKPQRQTSRRGGPRGRGRYSRR